MANARIPIPTLYGGVSRQADTIRHLNQVQEAENVQLTVRDGLSKRNGSRMEFEVTDLVSNDSLRVHVVDRDEDEKYFLIYGNRVLRAFGTDGTEYPVVMSTDAENYLNANDAGADGLRFVTVADYTIGLNRTVETDYGTSLLYEIEKEHVDYDDMTAHTPAHDTYHRAKEATTARTAGYWKYDPGVGTFGTISFPQPNTSQTIANVQHVNKNPGGFKIGFIRVAMSQSSCTWDVSELELTKASAFADYIWREGDKLRVVSGTDIAAGWYVIASRKDDNTIVMESSIGTSDNADTVINGIGAYATVTIDFQRKTLDDMHDVARGFQEALQDGGAPGALCEWVYDEGIDGHMVITNPFRGDDTTIIEPDSPDSGYDHTNTNDNMFYTTGETTVAGTDTPLEDTLPVIDRWVQVAAPKQDKAVIDATTMPIQIVREQFSNLDYFETVMELAPFAYWRLGEKKLTTGDGLLGSYYEGSNFDEFKGTRIDTTVNFDWDTSEPFPGVTHPGFTVQWTGYIKPQFTEAYTFYAKHTGKSQLWINDVLLFNTGFSSQYRETTGESAVLTGGTLYTIVFNYFHLLGGDGRVDLSWSSSSQSEEVIPQTRLLSTVDQVTTAADETTNNDGTYTNLADAAFGQTGAIEEDGNTAVLFDGSNDYINCTTLGTFPSQIDDSGFSIELWAKADGADPSEWLLGTKDGSNERLDLSLVSGVVNLKIKDDSANTANLEGVTSVLDDTEWHHIVVTWDKDAPTVAQLYLDGDWFEELTDDGTGSWPVAALFTTFTRELYVGAYNNGGSAAGFFDGTLDEVVLYAHVITAAQINQNYLVGVRSNDRLFNVTTIDWADRFTGDQNSNPLPELIENNSKITDLAFHRNRFTLAGDERMILSQAGDFFNLWLEDDENIGDADPIDTVLTANQVTIIDYLVPFRKVMVMFTKVGRQFELNAPETLTPNTAAITPSTAYKSLPVAPQPAGNAIYFAAQNEDTTQLLEYVFSDEKAASEALDISAHVAGYLPADIQTIQTALNINSVLVLPADSNVIYVYTYFWDADKKIQSAWSKLTFDSTERIVDIGVLGTDCWMLIENADTFFMSRFSLTREKADTDYPYRVCLDNRKSLTGVLAAGETTWTLPVEDSTIDTAVLGPDFGGDAGTVVALTEVSSTSVKATGDYTDGAATIGRLYDMDVELSRPYARSRDGAAIIDANVSIMKLMTNHRNTGAYTIRVEQPDRAARDYDFSPRDGEYLEDEGNNQAVIMGNAKDTTISILNDSALPVSIASGEFVINFVQRSL